MKEERFPDTRKPLRRQRLQVAEGGSFGATEESTATGVWRKKRRDSCTEDQCRPALTSPRGLSAHPPGWAGAGSWGSGFWVWIPGRGLGLVAWTQSEGASAPRLAGKESGKKSGTAEEARDFFLPLCLLVRKERRFRAPLKGAPETGTSHSYQRGLQTPAWDTKAAAATTKKPVCKHRSLSTPPLQGACAAHHCQGPVIQGQLPWENARHASGCCKVMLAFAATGLPRIRTPPSPRPEWARAPESAAPLTLSCLREEQMPSGHLHTEAGPNPKLDPGSCVKKKRKGNFSQQPQEQWIKYPQPTWCTLHLWNTWIDNESSQTEEVDFESNDVYIFIPFSLFVSVYVYTSVCDFVCISLLLPFVLGFCLSFFFKNYLKNYFS